MNVSSLSSSKSSSSTSSSYSSSPSALLSGMSVRKAWCKKCFPAPRRKSTGQTRKTAARMEAENYRTCTSTINALYSTLDTSYDAVVTNNLANSKFFNQMSSAVSGSGVKNRQYRYFRPRRCVTHPLLSDSYDKCLAKVNTMSGIARLTRPARWI